MENGVKEEKLIQAITAFGEWATLPLIFALYHPSANARKPVPILGIRYLARISGSPSAVPNLATHLLFLSRRIATKFEAKFCLTQDGFRRTREL